MARSTPPPQAPRPARKTEATGSVVGFVYGGMAAQTSRKPFMVAIF